MNDRKLFLIFHGRFPGEKPSSLFAAKSAEAFGEVMPTILLVPRRRGRFTSNPYEYFAVKKNFKVVFLPTLDLFGIKLFSRVAFFISHFVFSLFSTAYVFFHNSKKDYVYSNENLPLYFTSFFHKNCFYEMHDFPRKSVYFFYKKFLARMKGVLIHNKWKTEKGTRELGLAKEKVICEPNAVEIDEFDLCITKDKARQKLSLDLESNIVVYTGSLLSWKGVHTLALSAKNIPHVEIYFVGGSPSDVSLFKNLYQTIPTIHIVGHKKHEEIIYWQKAADVLVIPNTAKEDISKYYTSPMKLFEYMVSKRPIVASRIPSIEEIVGEDDVYFFTPDDEVSLGETITHVLSDTKRREEKIASSLSKVYAHTWRGRRERILSFIEHLV